ncbi:MAG: proprotein convertase P-domain-containing protein, partial [Deltaproteobacteria bacterium]|nr:proprotein convertase P-domain-containing protein [Deltaproteobacteria bacterium]
SLSDGAATLDLHRLTGGAADDVFRVYELADPAHVPGSLSQLLGQHPDGTWTLRVQDSLAGDIGQLEYWSLYLDLADLLDDGEPCATDDQCLSDYCGNGFCCQGTGSGDCCAVKTDCVNHGGVVYWAAAVCDIPADCQGHRLEPSCAGFECVATLVADDSGCAGEEAAPCLDCRPLPVCTAAVVQDDPSARCPDTCGNDDAVCSAGCHCDGTSALPQGICVTDLDVGDPCVEESDCLDGQHCQNGVCCPDGKVCCTTWGQCPNAGGTLDPGILQYSPPSCGLTPATCQGSRKDKACQDAQCTALTVADDRGCGPDVLHSLCGFYPSVFCDGTAEQVPSCASSCASDDGCDPDAHCTGGLCVADYSDGHACDDGDGLGDSECVSAHCGNGFCCAAGDCCAAPADCLPAGYATPAWCASPETCQGFRRDALCLAFSCATGGVVADDSACDELLDCAPYLTEQCDGAPDQPVAACPDTCESDADCVPAAHCRAGPPDGLKHCYYKKYDGEDCDGSWECVSGNCGGPAGQTVCCAAGKDCCPGNDPATCPLSYTGAAACDGPGLCQGTRRDPACATWVCASTTVEDDRGCTSGFVASSLDCGCYPSPACNGQEVQAPACPTSCTGDGQCEVPCHCDGGCVGDLGNGEPCDEPSD